MIIQLTKGCTAIVDDTMYKVLCYSWFYRRDGYAATLMYIEGIRKGVAMHRYIYSLVHGPIPPKMVIDHINGNKLDNRIENLRCVTRQQNAANLKCHREGVNLYRIKDSCKLRAVVWYRGKTYNAGCYDTTEEVTLAKQRKLAELQRLSST